MSSRQDSRPSGRGVREALDQLELGGDLAALVGDLLLGAAAAVSIIAQQLGRFFLTSRAGMRRHRP